MKKAFWIIGVCLTMWAGPVYAENIPVVLNNKNTEYSPSKNSSFFADLDKNTTLGDILSEKTQKKFMPIGSNLPHFGLNDTPVWIKFQVISHLDEDFYLKINNPALQSIDFYLVTNSQQVVHHEFTGSTSLADESNRNTGFHIKMNIPDAGLYTCYLRVQTSVGSLQVPMQIATLHYFYTAKHHFTMWQGAYFGLILFMFVYNTFLYFSLRDTTYVYFAFFILFIGIMFAAFQGIGADYLWNDIDYLNTLVPVYGSLAGIAIMLFTSRFLHSDKNTPRLHLWLIAISALFVLNIIIFFTGAVFLANRLIMYNSVVALFFMMFVAMKVWQGGYKPAKYFLFAWSFFVAGLIVFLLRETGLLPFTTLIKYVLQISSSLSIVFMSFALSKKINIYIETRNQAQELALHTALENERLISDQNQLLEARVTERTIDLKETVATLQKQQADLDEANSFKDKIFSIISHDLKSPIATLAGLLQVLKLKTLSEAEKNKVVVNLEIALKATKNLLDNMLAWSVKHDRKAIETEELLLREIVDDVMSLFQYQAESKNILLRNLVEGNYYFYANKNMIQLVLRNLISNSIKFTPKNGLVEVGMMPDVPHISLYIKDTGIGMSGEFIEKLFKTNVHTSTRGTDNEKGTGLGLKLCKEFLEKMNGTLMLESEPGQGSTFTVILQNAVPELESALVE